MKKSLLVAAFLLYSIFSYAQNCTLSVKITPSSTVICSGTNAVLTADISGGTAPYNIIWNTGETTSFISVNKAATYTVTVSDNTPGCQPVKASVTITAAADPPPPTVAGIAVCKGSSGTLTASAPGGTYNWYDSATGGKVLGSGASFVTPAINANTVFYVEAIVAGCISTRSAVNVYIYGAPATLGGVTCEGNAVTLSALSYVDNIWYDAPVGGNRVGTGATFTTPPLSATTTYYVAGVYNGCETDRSPVTAVITKAPAPPTAQNVSICSGTTANLQASAPAGQIDWFDVPTGGTSLITSPDFTTPVLTATKTYYVQVTTGCSSTRTPVTITVTQTPSSPIASPVTVCPGSPAHLTATTDVGVLEWFSRPAGGNMLGSGSSFDTPPLSINTTYYVQANNGGCYSGRVPVIVTVSIRPDAPSVTGTLICNGGNTTLTASGSTGTYQWFDAATGGTLLASTNTYTTPALGATKTYYVQAVSASGCVSIRTAADVTVLAAIPAPSALSTTVCSGDRATLTASGGSGYQWFDAPTGGNKLGDGPVFVSPGLTSSVTYYVQATNSNGCVSPRSSVAVTVNPIPTAPSGTGASVCTGTSATLSASTASGTIAWYDAAIGGNLLGTGNTFTTGPLNNETVFYAETQNNGCVSSRTPVTASIITGTNPQFIYPYGSVCSGAANVIPTINNPAGGTFSASPAGLVFVSTATGEINVSASLPGTYTISFANNGICPSVTKTNFAIGSGINAAFSYTGPFCQSDANPLPVYPGRSSGGTFSASPAGLVFANTSSGEIDLLKSAPGTYTITNTIGGASGCAPNVATSAVTIYARAIVNAGPDQLIKIGNTAQLNASITGGATTGTWTGGAGTFANNTSLNTVYTAAPGETVATLTLTSADPAGTCGPVSDVVKIYFGSVPATPTAQGATICAGNSATLSATAPGGIYKWYDVATGGSVINTGHTFDTPVLTANKTYYVATELDGATSARRAVTVTVTPSPAVPVVTAPTICVGAKATLTVSNAATATYRWYSAATGGNLLAVGSTYTTPELNENTSFYVDASSSGCTSTRTKVDVVVNPYAGIVSSSFLEICSGTALDHQIVADVPTATFNWSRAAIAGISNAAVNNQTSASLTETLINTSAAPIDVTYHIIPMAGTCPGAPQDLVVTVYPDAKVTSAANINACNGSASNYTITFDKPVNGLTWSRAAVAGISNTAIEGQAAQTIHETLFNTSNAPVDVLYVFNYTIGTCTRTFTLTVSVKPGVNITSTDKNAACNNVPLPYTITSNVPSATFTWTRSAVASNGASSGTGNIISERLVNNTNAAVTAYYTIVPTAFGCSGAPFYYSVTVNPTPPAPEIRSNSPVCIESNIMLYAKTVNGVTYQWSGPNGWTSALQNPSIPASVSASGRYILKLLMNGCEGPSAFVDVVVNPKPIASAGPNVLVCPTAPYVQLAGKISGGASTGIWTIASGSGTLPNPTDLNARYYPSATDRSSEGVVLTLTSTNKDDCSPAVSNLTITFGLTPAVNAGPDQDVCIQANQLQLNAKLLAGTKGSWKSNGSGTFDNAALLNAIYRPSAADLARKEIKLTFTVSDAGPCYSPSDEMLIELIPPPTVNMGGTRYVLKGRKITLTPTISDANVTYSWSPNINISNTTVKDPVITGDVDTKYTLTVTDSRGCTTTADVLVRVSPVLTVPNTFTPNGDGINDAWNVTGLIAYEDATIDIFDRAGQRVFRSVGYSVPWDGTFSGRQLPVGVYYYIIDTKISGKMTGSLTIIR